MDSDYRTLCHEILNRPGHTWILRKGEKIWRLFSSQVAEVHTIRSQARSTFFTFSLCCRFQPNLFIFQMYINQFLNEQWGYYGPTDEGNQKSLFEFRNALLFTPSSFQSTALAAHVGGGLGDSRAGCPWSAAHRLGTPTPGFLSVDPRAAAGVPPGIQ